MEPHWKSGRSLMNCPLEPWIAALVLEEFGSQEKGCKKRGNRKDDINKGLYIGQNLEAKIRDVRNALQGHKRGNKT